jgi:hypothetical protein
MELDGYTKLYIGFGLVTITFFSVDILYKLQKLWGINLYLNVGLQLFFVAIIFYVAITQLAQPLRGLT